MKKKAQSTKESQSLGPNKSFEEGGKPNKSYRTKDAGKESAKESAKAAKNSGVDINQLILKDHRPLKALFDNLKNVEIVRSQKEDQLEEFVSLLKAHAKAEEQSLYLAMRAYEILKIDSYHGDSEHAIAEQLIHEINACPDDFEWVAKVRILAELVENHMRQEEDNLLPKLQHELAEGARQMIGEEYTRIITEFRALNPKQPAKRVSFGRTDAATVRNATMI